MRRSFLAVILLTVFTANFFAQNQEAFLYLNEKNLSFSNEQARILSKAKEEKALSSYQLLRFNNLTSIKDQVSFNISLPGKASLTAARQRFEEKNVNEWVFSGTLNGDNGSIFLSATDGDVTGVIQNEQELYWLQPLGKGLHILIKVDQHKIPRDEPEDWNPIPDTSKSDDIKIDSQIEFEEENLSKTLTTTPTISILIAYTQAVAQNSGNITSLVNACIQSTNQSFANSNMTSNVQVALANAVQVTYTESGNVGTDLLRLYNPNDGYMDNVYELRNQYHADLVVLLVDFDNYDAAGVAYGIEVSSENAYCIVVDNYAVGNYTFAHEIGHLIGARHDNDPNISPRAYSHGFRYNPAYWRTIMAVWDPVVLRINYWSSPLNTYGGVAMGTASWRDARRVWNERVVTVAAFRSLSVSISGSSYLNFKQKGTYTAQLNGGSGNISYIWYKLISGQWTQIGTGPSTQISMVYSDIQLKVDVHDNVTGENASATKTIYYGFPPPKIGENNVNILPEDFILEQNFPNPFNPETEISFGLPEQSSVKITILDILGREIIILENEQLSAGYHTKRWNGSDATGRSVGSGIYFYQISAKGESGKEFNKVMKMVMLK